MIAFAIIAVVLLVYLLFEISTTNKLIHNTNYLYNNQFMQMEEMLKCSKYAHELSFAMTLTINPDLNTDSRKLQPMINDMKENFDNITVGFNQIEELIVTQVADKYLYFETFRHNISLISENLKQFEEALNEHGREKATEIFLNKFLINFDNLINSLDRLTEITERESETLRSEIISLHKQKKIMSIVVFFLLSILIFLLGTILAKGVISRLNEIKEILHRMALGELHNNINQTSNDEIGQIQQQLNIVNNNLNRIAIFARDIGESKLDENFTPLSANDILGNSLISTQQNLKKALIDAEIRKIEEQKQNWINRGIAEFGDILRARQENLDELGYRIIQHLVNYLEIQQGGLFIYRDEDPTNLYLELIATYAYSRRKYLEKSILIGEGLVGTCAEERKITFISEIPDDYLYIDSGFGETTPRYLLLVPLILDDKLFGVVELAALEIIADYRISLVEKIAETIAATLNNVKISRKTERLLKESEQFTEAMVSQEEEMRQNLEEIMATQEEIQRKNEQTEKLVERLKSNENELKDALTKSRKTEKELKEKEVLMSQQLEQLKKLEIKVNKLNLNEEEIKSLKITDLFDLNRLQQLQDMISKVLGVASVITDTKGVPITKHSNFSHLCKNIIGCTEIGSHNCQTTAKTMGEFAKDKWSVMPCIGAEIMDGAATFWLHNRSVAYWVIGQVLPPNAEKSKMLAYADKINADKADFEIALNKIPVMEKDRFEQILQLLSFITEYMSELATQSIKVAKFTSNNHIFR